MLIPQLGFYWDDWPVVMMAKQGDVSVLRDFYSYDRPFSYWTYLLTLPVLGTDPQLWQLFTVGLRILAALFLWRALLEMWPQRRFTTAGTALLFAVYPSFVQQNISLAYSQHFIAYGLFFLSIWAMLRAENDKIHFWPWTLLSLGTAALHLATMEYFAGLELIRPLLLIFSFHEKGIPLKAARGQALKRWIPYVVLLLIFVVWRFFLLSLPEDPNQPALLSSLGANPLEAILLFIQKSVQDFIYVVLGPWNNTIYSGLVDFSDLSLLASIALAAISGFVVAVYLRTLSRRARESAAHIDWGMQAVTLGAAAIFLGMLPVRVTDRDVLTGLFADRFTLPALFGAALLWVGLARLTLRKPVYRGVLIGALVGLSVGMHFRIAHQYAQDWEKQSRVYWQLHWRVPSLQPGTALVGEGALSGYVSEYAASAAINSLYRSPIQAGRVQYWVLDYYDDLQRVMDESAGEVIIEKRIRNLNFTGSTEQLLFFDNSSTGQCVWILDQDDEFNLDIEPEFRELASRMTIDQISMSAVEPPYADVFGIEPEPSWCYYYQKMELAAQMGDWDMVLALWREAGEAGYRPNNQYEMMSVLEAFVRTGQLNRAADLSKEILGKQVNVAGFLCNAWQTWVPIEDLPVNLLEDLGC